MSLTFVFFALTHLHGQKLVKKAWINPKTEYVQIDSGFCYQVNLFTSRTEELVVEASIEGEYSKDLLISIEEQGANLLIGACFQPNFTHPNDKLSAHKLISIALDIHLPQYKNVFVFGTSSHVMAKGKYKNLKVTLSDGRCILDNVIETAEVTTQKGDIMLMTPSGDIVAESTYGRVVKDAIPSGDNQFILNTVEGKIHLKKTK